MKRNDADYTCTRCHREYEYKLVKRLCSHYDIIQCLSLALEQSQTTISGLKNKIDFWKDGWYEGREIIGQLWLHHPAIDNEQERIKYQQYRNNNPATNDLIGMITPEWKAYHQALELSDDPEYQQYLKLRRKFHDY